MNANPDWIHTLQDKGPSLAPILQRIAGEAEYQEKLRLCEWLMRETQNQPDHPLGPVLDTVTDRIVDYENHHLPMLGQSPDPIGTLRFLMDQHGLKQKDLTQVLGSAGVVSEILSGKRQLNKTHITRLAGRFNVSPALFF